jgi:hypothetical protein
MATKKRRRSALESYDGCPHRYDQLHNKGVEDRGDESQRGVAFHEAAFRYIDRLVQQRTPADAEEAELAFKDGISNTQLPAHIVDEVARIWQRFAEYFELDLDAYMSAEEVLESDRFTWVPDLVYVRPSGVEIKDWKTYYKGLTETQARKEFQLKFYLLQAIDTWPGFPFYSFTFNFVRLGYEVTVKLTAEEIEKFRPEVEAIIQSLEEAERTQSWPAIPGSHCTLCRLVCPIVDNPARLPIRFTNAVDAKTAAGEVLALEQRLKVLKKALSGWCNQEGPMVVKGQEFAHSASVTVSYPAGALVDKLREAYPPTELTDQANTVSLSATAVKKADPLKILRDKLGELEQTNTRWAFRHKKAGEIEGADDDDEE